MKLAFSTLACPRWSIEEVAAAARAYGYDGVELRLIDGRLFDSSLSRADRERVRRTFADARLPIVAVDTSVEVSAEGDAGATVDELAGMTELASEWSSPIVRVFGGGRAISHARSILGGAAPEAGRLGVTIALETHDQLSSAAVVAEVLRDMPPSVAALWDVAHTFRAGEDADAVLQLLDGRIAHVHVKDARGDVLTPLGEGDVPIRPSLEMLDATGYGGWISVEWEKHWHPELAEPEVALPQFASLLRSWSREG